MRGHFQDVKQLIEKDISSDSYARHFASMAYGATKAPTPGMQRDKIRCAILWQGNPLSAVKTFGKNSCKLCNRERMEIIKQASKPVSVGSQSTHEWKFMAPGATFHGSIGYSTRQQSVLMSAGSAKKSLLTPLPKSAEEN